MGYQTTIYGSTSNAYITPGIDVYLDGQSIANNTSTVRVRFYLKKSSVSTAATYGTFSGYLYINGSRTSVSKYITVSPNNAWVYVSEYTVVVPHNDDGSKKVSVSVSGGIGGTTYTSTSCSGTVTLPTIARASTAIVPSSAVMGSAVSIAINRASASFTHDVTWSFGNLSGTLATGSSSLSFSWTPDTATLAPTIPNAESGTATIKVKTYSGSTVIGTKSAAFKLSVPDTAVPTIGAVSATEAEDGIAAQFGAFVQSKSKISVSISAAGVYGSSIKSYSSAFDGVSYSGADWVSGFVSRSGTVAIKTTVTDSRGKTATKTTNIAVLAYSRPKISAFKAWRVDSTHGIDVGGDYIAVQYSYSVSPLNNHNTALMTVNAGVYGSGRLDKELLRGTALSADTTACPAEQLSSDTKWDVKISLADWFGESTSVCLVIPTAAVIMDFKADGEGMAIGKVAESTGLEISWPTSFREAVNMDVPLGIASGGTGAADADAARVNLDAMQNPVLLWQGMWTSGSITVSKTGGSVGCTGFGDVDDYRLLLLNINDSALVFARRIGSLWHFGDIYTANAGSTVVPYMIGGRFTASGNVLTYGSELTAYWSTGGSLTISSRDSAVKEIYGIAKL